MKEKNLLAVMYNQEYQRLARHTETQQRIQKQIAKPSLFFFPCLPFFKKKKIPADYMALANWLSALYDKAQEQQDFKYFYEAMQLAVACNQLNVSERVIHYEIHGSDALTFILKYAQKKIHPNPVKVHHDELKNYCGKYHISLPVSIHVLMKQTLSEPKRYGMIENDNDPEFITIDLN